MHPENYGLPVELLDCAWCFQNHQSKKILPIMKFTTIQSITLLSAILVLFTGCNSSSTGVEDTPPVLPPSVVLETDFALFSENNAGANIQAGANKIENPYSHFLNASTRALLLNGTINANLFLPASILTAAEAVEPVLNEDDEWEWNFSVSGNSQTFSVSLVGEEQDSGQTTWSVFVSNSLLNLDDELLLEGVSTSNSGSGSWTVNRLAGFGTVQPHLQLDWDFDSVTEYSVDLEFLQMRDLLPVQSIRTQRDGPEKQTISRDMDDDLRADISWNVDTKTGSLVSPEYNNGDRACWDSTFRNTECE